MTSIQNIQNFIKNNYEKISIDQIFEELLFKNNYFFDIELAYFSFLNEMIKNGGTIDDKKTNLKEVRNDYNFKQKVKIYYNNTCIISKADIDECSICHIKPFYESDDDEKYDFRNGIILSESLHKLFDKYYFTIDPTTYKIIISNKIINKKLLINDFNNIKVNINKESLKYLQYHYNCFIEKNKE